MARKKAAEAPAVEEPVVAAKKTKKTKAPVKVTAAKAAYQLALHALHAAHGEYATGMANDELFPTPGKQKKVAKQIAKLHNRLLSKSKLDGLELPEELDVD
jgi:hypothetical protein